MILLSWSTTLHYNFRDCSTCVQGEPYLPHSTIQLFSPIIFYRKKCLKVDIVCIYIRANTHFQYVLNPKIEIPTTHEIILVRLVLCAIVLFFGATYAITFFVDYFIVCQTYAVTLLELRLFETEKSFFQEIIQLIIVLFAAESVVFVVVCISFLWCYCLEAPLFTTIFMTVKHVFKRNLTCCTQIFNLSPYSF